MAEEQLIPVYVNPWLSIWRHPRRAFHSAIALRNPLETGLLASLAGISATLAWAAWGDLADGLAVSEILALAFFGGPLLGLVVLLCSGVLLRTGGELLGGQAGAGRVRAALAWSTLPVIAGLPLWIIQAILLPNATFGVPTQLNQALLARLGGMLQAALWLWGAGLSLPGLAEAHHFSLARAAGSWLLALLVLISGFLLLFGGTALLISLRGG